MSKLKPCPFCGHENNHVNGYKTFWIMCRGCGMETPLFESKIEVEQFWNRREKCKKLQKSIA